MQLFVHLSVRNLLHELKLICDVVQNPKYVLVAAVRFASVPLTLGRKCALGRSYLARGKTLSQADWPCEGCALACEGRGDELLEGEALRVQIRWMENTQRPWLSEFGEMGMTRLGRGLLSSKQSGRAQSGVSEAERTPTCTWTGLVQMWLTSK
jgi:hypothetical protein